jgi:CRP/FNR family transcriptional regulator
MVTLTHQQLANELGTAREVVSRLLKQLEKQGYLINHRGKIEIIHVM